MEATMILINLVGFALIFIKQMEISKDIETIKRREHEQKYEEDKRYEDYKDNNGLYTNKRE